LTQLSNLVSDLVAIDSVNPGLVPGAAGEEAIARFVASWLKSAGLDVEVDEVAPRRPNVVGVARGSGGGRSLMLNAHMDTVGGEAMERPHEPVVEGNKLFGRGAYDMKGSLAAIMLAGAEAHRRGLRGDVIVAAVADEELASIGTEDLVRRRTADAAIVAEPTELRLAVAHKGFAALELETLGTAAHGSRPDLGVDAIAKMGRLLVRLEELDRSLRTGEGHELLGTGSVHASIIEGGQEFSSYPERCSLKAERRTVPGESPELVQGELDELIASAAAGDPDFRGSARVAFHREPFEVDRSEPIMEIVGRHAGDAEVIGVPFWTDAALLAGAAIPTVVFGPSGEGAHAAVEWVDLASVERCVEIFTATAAEFCV
jgi:acetylornithine deacetylase/succinyl-diaminopimelate desuccinylase-like protein